MKKLVASLALVALFSANAFAQEIKKEVSAKKAKTEKVSTTEEKKACSTDKKACCASKSAVKKA